MGLLVSLLFVLATTFCISQGAQKVLAYKPGSPLAFSALQTHMPTKQGDVPHLHPQESISPNAPPKIKLDPDQLQREARELLEISQSLQSDIDSLNHGLYPKDTIEKLKRIQKLAKHLRQEIAP